MPPVPGRSATERSLSMTWSRSSASAPARPARPRSERPAHEELPMTNLIRKLCLPVALLALPALSHAQAAPAVEAVVHKGDVAWMMTATLLVLFMAMPDRKSTRLNSIHVKTYYAVV